MPGVRVRVRVVTVPCMRVIHKGNGWAPAIKALIFKS